MKVVVTGAAGFLGSHLVDRLLKEGYHVIGIDNLSSGDINNLKNAMGYSSFKFVKADLLDPSKWLEEIRNTSIIFHFAANPEVRHSVEEPIKHYRQNLTATMYILEAARRQNVKTIVFASSSTVYGDPEKIPTPETHPIRPISIYGATKAAAEIMIKTYHSLYRINALILRYANIVGPRLRHGVIYDFIIKLSNNSRVIEVLGDGSQKKSYLYVNDAIEATLAALNIINESNKSIEIYNIGNNDWISVNDIINVIANTLKLDMNKIKRVYKPGTFDGRGWPGDVKMMLLDINKITKDTQWRPSMTSIEAVRATAESLVNELIRK